MIRVADGSGCDPILTSSLFSKSMSLRRRRVVLIPMVMWMKTTADPKKKGEAPKMTAERTESGNTKLVALDAPSPVGGQTVGDVAGAEESTTGGKKPPTGGPAVTAYKNVPEARTSQVPEEKGEKQFEGNAAAQFDRDETQFVPQPEDYIATQSCLPSLLLYSSPVCVLSHSLPS